MVTGARLAGLTVDIALRRGRRPDTVNVLDDVNLEVPAGQVTALIGESGCGKSLVVAALSGLLPPGSRARGLVHIGDRELRPDDERSWRALRGRHVGVVPQSAATSFTPVRTVGSQLAEISARLGVSGREEQIGDRGREEQIGVRGREEQMGVSTPEQLCAAVALPAGVVHRYPHELSGGMAARVAIAAALAGRPALLLADEPTSALDPENAALVWRLLGTAAADGAAVLVVTHDMPSLLRAEVCDDVAVMTRGTVRSRQPLADALADPDPYLRALLGTVPV
ncbi:ATP-binding cassette domain-containing protein [Mycobacterium sp. SMC-8]|uniref:ATP-binding cassette domain-containing protein n=1 Tax=Mycobacterium sp. SMC-8 TaxID=2857060 RepID=UPI0021B4C047|nr:ATP-binding cassette domain-containing protein [Mycobacterium sp. SMC-8]UXA15264.1 ATP-binding cassette domain-containing protein [Mycobacterium sp. SMC-8]